MNLLKNIISIKNEKYHKIISLAGLKIKFIRNKKYLINLIKQYEINEAKLKREIKDFKDKWALNCPVYQPHCVSWFGSFKEEFLKPDFAQKLSYLKKNLDAESQDIVDLFLRKTIFLPDSSIMNDVLFSKSIVESWKTEKDKTLLENYEKELPEYQKKFNLLGEKYMVETFYFHNGLRFCNQKIKEYIKGKDFIDGGAYIGDSVLVFEQYFPLKTYSFEISVDTAVKFQEIMKLNNISSDRYQLINMGLSDRKGQMTFDNTHDPGTSVLSQGNNIIEVTDLDSFTSEHSLNVGFLKLDVEGAAYETILGAKETIKRDRPVISCAVYHSPKEFFEVKPLLEEITKDLNYVIEFKNLQYQSHIAIEFILFAYPKELQ